MKQLIIAVALMAMSSVQAMSKPILVGHRGSYYGVENTAESFRNGALRGYSYLETDVKVTKDGQHVCSHNDDLAAVGGTLTIATSTLAELQAQPLTQTRGGVKYTGHLCSLKEYLDICAEYNVKPLIELKWATGINSNDCSGIPALIKVVEEKGFRDKVIFLTSMKPCLEYIRTHYPDIELQFLTGQYWANHFDWNVKWRIDVNIQSGYFDKTTVQRFHDEDLKVNMWTTNTADGYKTYGNMGCDFITTDYLDPTALPELDESALFPANTTDYPLNECDVLGYYDLQLNSTAGFPSALSNKTVDRALFHSGKWIVLAHSADGTATIVAIDPADGSVQATVDTANLNICDIGITADGMLIGCSKYDTATDGNLTLYKWESLLSPPKELYTTYDMGLASGNGVFGKTMAVSGKTTGIKVFVHGALTENSDATDAILGIDLKNNVKVLNYLPSSANIGANAKFGTTPSCRDFVLVQNAPTMQPAEFCFDWETPGGTAILKKTLGSAVTAAGDVAMTRYGNKAYAIVPAAASDNTLRYRIYDITSGFDTPYSASSSFDATKSLFNACAIQPGDNVINAYCMSAEQGLQFWSSTPKKVEVVEDIDLKVKRLWILSNTTDNAPAHIDGTNAQQGTAVNGVFYINDCVDKKIYLINSEGNLGSIPGGAGWGCARDDRGNIVVRDDKLTANVHSFIIYPAGATVDNPGTPVRLDNVETPLAGQTNFINASGDLLNGTGRIYLFPNKLTQAAIITVEHGVVTDTRVSGELMLTGTTAGYIIPRDNDPESWIYQVRGTGLYFYDGGKSTSLSTSRASTSAPSRNSTGGGAFFKIKGNEVFAHNSGTNYKGGFTVRNNSKSGKNDEVVTSFDPIGKLGYETGGNYSTFNWLIPEKINDSAYMLYQYCPSNGVAAYVVYDANTYDPESEAGIEDVIIDNIQLNSAIYNLQGVKVDETYKGIVIKNGTKVYQR